MSLIRRKLPVLTLGFDGDQDQVYNEDAFRYFMELDRKRAERSSGSFMLLLVEWTGQSNGGRFEPRVADRVFSLMAPCLRETDLLGWYSAGRIAGALLTRRTDAPGAEASSVVTERVDRALGAGLPAGVVGQLNVRVYDLSPNQGRS